MSSFFNAMDEDALEDSSPDPSPEVVRTESPVKTQGFRRQQTVQNKKQPKLDEQNLSHKSK